jgi:hypothetical protein
MRNLPSIYRTTKINSIAERFNLTDPFRTMFPNRKEYTYILNAAANINRSRIDFFLISNNILHNVTESDVPIGKLSSLFDHKTILLSTRKKLLKRDPNKIKDSILDLVPVQLAVKLAVKEFYLNNTDRESVLGYIINNLRFDFGHIYHRLEQASALELTALKENNYNDALN